MKVKSKNQKGIREFPPGTADFSAAHPIDSTRSDKEASASYTLETLLAGVTPENLHKELETGQAVGNEAW